MARCRICGTEIMGEHPYCERCAPVASGTPQSSDSDILTRIVPYKNRYALIGYYLAVFSLIPCVGALLALAAVPLGLMGLSEAKRNPEAHGKVHAWVAIILGMLVLIAHASCGVLMLGAPRSPS